MIKSRIFIDFWNFQLSLNGIAGKAYRADWTKLSAWLIARAQAIIGSPLQHEGTTVYLSYDPRKPEDKSLRDWANNFLDHLPGVNVVMQERKPKNPPVCPSCHTNIEMCPHCSAAMAGTIEKGCGYSHGDRFTGARLGKCLGSCHSLIFRSRLYSGYTNARLRDQSLRIFYSPADDPLNNFYIPALSSCVRYDHSAGYFSSTALAVAAAGAGMPYSGSARLTQGHGYHHRARGGPLVNVVDSSDWLDAWIHLT